MALRTVRNAPSAAAQRGQAMMIAVIILILGIAGAVYTTATSGIAALANRQADDTTRAMADVKEALIGWSAARDPAADGANARPGELPCPDISPLDGYQDGSCIAGAIGRVPWKTLGITEPKDATGETLWYAIAGPFRPYNGSIPATTMPITSDTLGNIRVYLDSASASVTTQAIAVILAPGQPLGTQDRSSSSTMACAAPSGTYTRNLCAENYLDTVAGINNGNPNSNANPPSFIQARASSAFNDRVLAIASADLMPIVERRVAREMISILQRYKTATGTSTLADLLPGIGVYPWADRSDGGSNDWNHNRFPCGTALPVNWNTPVPLSLSGARTPALPNWLSNGCTNPVTGWTSVIYYAVAKNKLELNGALCSNCVDATLTITNPSTSSSVIDSCASGGTACAPYVMASLASLTGDLLLITAGAASTIRASVCASPPCWPTTNFNAIVGYFEDAENSDNQGVDSDKYVAPRSTNNDRDRLYVIR